MNSIEHVNFIKAPVSEVYRALVSETGLSAIWTPKLKVNPRKATSMNLILTKKKLPG